MKLKFWISVFFLLSLNSVAHAVEYKITAFGKHQVDPINGQKTVIYTYKLENFSDNPNGVSVFSIGDIGMKYPPLFDTNVSSVIKDRFISPSGWKGERIWLEESYRYYVSWKIAEFEDVIAGNYYLLPGQSSDKFVVNVTKVDPNYVNVQAMVQGKLINMIKADTAAPTAEIYLTTLPAAGKPGWLEVSVTAAAHDNMDPYPDVLLSKITANQTFPETDIQAVFNEETKKFLVKMAKDRTYNVTFTVMDASGNTTSYMKDLPAK